MYIVYKRNNIYTKHIRRDSRKGKTQHKHVTSERTKKLWSIVKTVFKKM